MTEFTDVELESIVNRAEKLKQVNFDASDATRDYSPAILAYWHICTGAAALLFHRRQAAEGKPSGKEVRQAE